jgi:diadenosine tetraphosphate (Ap4A) HIT family hydrolase
MTTAIHRMVAACRAGGHAAAVMKLPSGWVILAERQVLRGYCLLLPDPVVPDLNALASIARGRFLADMALVGDALIRATQAIRINYAIYGNLEPALHAHLFPRFASEPEATRTLQPFALDWDAAPLFNAKEFAPVQRELAVEIARAAARRVLTEPGPGLAKK